MNEYTTIVSCQLYKRGSTFVTSYLLPWTTKPFQHRMPKRKALLLWEQVLLEQILAFKSGPPWTRKEDNRVVSPERYPLLLRCFRDKLTVCTISTFCRGALRVYWQKYCIPTSFRILPACTVEYHCPVAKIRRY